MDSDPHEILTRNIKQICDFGMWHMYFRRRENHRQNTRIDDRID